MLKQLVSAALLGAVAFAATVPSAARAQENKAAGKIRVLIIDGQNNHDWRSTTPFMKKALEGSGRFTVDVATTPQKMPPLPKPKTDDEKILADYKKALVEFQRKADFMYQEGMARFRPDLKKYDVVPSNYNGSPWNKDFQKDLEETLKEGKIGLVIVHAANNSFGGSWTEYNRMIGMGWYNPKFGPRLYIDEAGKEVLVPKGKGDEPGHRYSGEFTVVIRDGKHPVTAGMPAEWMHARDELYDNMRGPIEKVHVLATAFSKGTSQHEPMIWTVEYDKGRVFHTPMGHDLNGMRCIGFITTLERGTEWAATGAVTLPIPPNFPSAQKSSSVPGK